MHAEVGQTVVGTLDASLAAYFSGAWGGSDIASLLTAGAGVWVSRNVVLGFRCPWLHVYTRDEPYDTQVSVEPWLRVDLRTRGFVSGRFNLPLAGFLDLDSQPGWGLLLGGGVAL